MDLETIHGVLGTTTPFLLLGAGPRAKFLYRAGVLSDARTMAVLHRWDVTDEVIEPAEYRIALQTSTGVVVVWEDEAGVWLESGHERTGLDTTGPIRLPTFDGHPYAAKLRVLHHDVLLNVVEGRPLPNFFVYQRPWIRDAAMMAMVLEQTGNLDLLAPWILSLSDPFDRNNAGEQEADNLGEALYLISLIADQHHPLVQTVLDTIPQYRQGDHIVGRTDFAEHPVYQTKWLKYGLRRLGLDDPFVIPDRYDSYDTLFWMDFREAHHDGPGFREVETRYYPYLAWAEAHFRNLPPPMHLLGHQYPLTWEANASQAHYGGMATVSEAYETVQLCAPHTWHAAEAFLYLREQGA
jgi:hypothetical protein